jgi:hypothetical protein
MTYVQDTPPAVETDRRERPIWDTTETPITPPAKPSWRSKLEWLGFGSRAKARPSKQPARPASNARPAAGRPAPKTAARRIALVLAVLLAVVIGVAFRGSWTSQSDSATATHFDSTGAALYPFGPDGLIVLALVAAVVLRHKRWPRLYCLAVVILFTGTSFVINHLHGLGKFVMVDGELVTPLEPWIVGLVAGQLVGAIAFGSHILMHVFKHLFPEALDGITAALVVEAAPALAAAPPAASAGPASEGDPATPAQPAADGYELAKLIYAGCLDGGVKLSQEKLGKLAGISKRRAGYARVDVDTQRAEIDPAHDADMADPEEFRHTPHSLNGSAPAGAR